MPRSSPGSPITARGSVRQLCLAFYEEYQSVPACLNRIRLLFRAAGDIGNPRHDALNPERQFGNFLSDLIVPEYLLRPLAMKIRKITVSAASDIAAEFNASLTEALIRSARSISSRSVVGVLPTC